MNGQTSEQSRVATGLRFGTLDADSASRIDTHLKRAQEATDDRKDFHIRHARQLLEACREP